ncbi:MAG: hypothetical protein ACKO7U_01710, partial [Actinomycetota bacterium]
MPDDHRPKLFHRSAAAATLVGAALLVGPAVAGAQASAGQPAPGARADEAACIADARAMARRVMWSVRDADVTRSWVDGEIARIRAASPECVDALFRDGTAANPNAGILTGNGHTYTAASCGATAACNGGHGGLLLGSGGNGANVGNGGNCGAGGSFSPNAGFGNGGNGGAG